MQSDIVDRFVAFVVAERDLYDSHDNNRVAFSLGQIGRYLRFVEITRSRFQQTSKVVTERFRRKIEEARQNPGTRELTAAEVDDLENDGQLHQLLHFEIESFFLFSKILLDKIAHFIGDYFGQAHGVSFRSHDKLCKGIDDYSKEKQLQLPDDMTNTMATLRSIVADYRDKQIAHLQNPRALHGTQISANGVTQIETSILYPNSKDKHSSSPSVEDVCSVVETYIGQLEMLVKLNRTKSRYKLHANG